MIYRYYCENCLAIFDYNLKIADRDLPTEAECPECKHFQIKREIGAPAISYTGSKTAKQRAGADFNRQLDRIKKSHPTQLRDGTKQTIN